VSEDVTTTKQMMEAYLQSAIEQAERIRTKYRNILNEALTGDRAFSDGLTLYVSPLLYDYYSQNGIPAQFTYLVKNEPLPKMSPCHWNTPPLDPIARQYIRDKKNCKRTRRKHRAAFRRRKRGLA
jgi:hypothetical protein